MGKPSMDQLNPVVLIVGFFAAVFGGGGGATIIVSLINRKAASATRTTTLEAASSAFREEVRKENITLKTDIREMKEAFIKLTDVLDDLGHKMVVVLDDEERKRFRDAVTEAKLLT